MEGEGQLVIWRISRNVIQGISIELRREEKKKGSQKLAD